MKLPPAKPVGVLILIGRESRRVSLILESNSSSSWLTPPLLLLLLLLRGDSTAVVAGEKILMGAAAVVEEDEVRLLKRNRRLFPIEKTIYRTVFAPKSRHGANQT